MATPVTSAEPALPVSVTRTLEELLENCRYLARYAVETDQLPASVDVKRLYKTILAFESGERIEDDDFAFLVSVYETLERRLGPVNATTLHATEDRIDGEGTILRSSLARKYVRYLTARTAVIIGLVLMGHLVHFLVPVPEPPDDIATATWVTEQITEDPMLIAGLIAMFAIPFLYGALGADAFLLRETTRKLHTRQFDPRRIPENRARFILGSLSGGVIVLFVSAEMLETPNTIFNVGGAALGFIAGFSTDFLFDVIDRVTRAILPRTGGITADHEDRRAEDEMLQRYRRLMDEAETDERKKILKEVVEDLETRARHGR